jgi:hypothetical protein
MTDLGRERRLRRLRLPEELERAFQRDYFDKSITFFRLGHPVTLFLNSTTPVPAFLLLLAALSGCAPPTPVPPQSVETARPPRVEAKADRPEWKIGYEWQYSWKDPSGSGTLVKEIIREEPFAGVPSFVVRRGKSEDFYTKDVLGLLGTMSGGRIAVKRSAPFQTLSWPLEVGKEWTNSYITERPGEKSSESFENRIVVAKQEPVEVPAGTFDAFKIEIYNGRTGTLLNEYWYGPEVKWFVKSRVYNREGVREEELESFKVD